LKQHANDAQSNSLIQEAPAYSKSSIAYFKDRIPYRLTQTFKGFGFSN
jgi:hypothetical protein